MASKNGTPVQAAVQTPPIVAELEALFQAVDDAPLLAALQGSVRRGPKGYPAKTLWQCFLTKYALGLGSTAALIRELRNNPFVAQTCGIGSPEAIPHEATFSRFFAKLTKRKYLHLVKDVSRSLVRRHYATLPAFGERVALDSTTLKGWANGGKAKRTDPAAGWSVKTNTQGMKESVYGWKLHLLVDCEHELPIAAHVSPGNVHDQRRASNVLVQARFTMKGKFHPRYIMADKGYSGHPLSYLIQRQYSARPIIQVLPSHKKLMAKLKDTMNTPEWKALFKQRTAVERAFSRLKGQHALNSIRVRGLRKVTVHCYLALIAMQTHSSLLQQDVLSCLRVASAAQKRIAKTTW